MNRGIFALAALVALTACDGTGPSDALPPPPPELALPDRPEPISDPVEVGTTQYEGDLTVSYIQRLPEIDYVWGSTDPTREGWPDVGQTVTWRGQVKNWASTERAAVGYRWLLDGNPVDSGVVDIGAMSEAAVDLEWAWTFDRHELTLEIDPADEVDEEDRNNRRTLHTDALAVGLYVEQSLYDYFRQYQHELAIGSNCFEDWAHRQIRFWNDMFGKAIYPEAPDGVLDRVRIDRIHVVPDGALPLVPATSTGFTIPQSHPNDADRTVDLVWGFPASFLDHSFYSNLTDRTFVNPFYYSAFLLHEMGHARYLVDIAAWDVYDGEDNRIEIQEDGEPVVGTRWMPAERVNFNGEIVSHVHSSSEPGLMNALSSRNSIFLDRYSAVAWNLIAGQRAVRGNYNGPENSGAFLNDLPTETRITLVDRGSGERLPGARVQVFRSEHPGRPLDPPLYYATFFDSLPDMEVTANDLGEATLGPNPFAGEGGEIGYRRLDPDDPLSRVLTNRTALLRVEHGGRVGYAFLESIAVNLAYWRGDTDLADIPVYVDLR